MKRLGNLYDEMCKFENIKCINIFKIYSVLKNKEYIPGPYYVFTIYEPKERRIVSQRMFDKAINHLVARYILQPAVFPCIIDTNVASRPLKGTRAGLEYYVRYQDDFLLFHESKEYLKECLIKIKAFLAEEKLQLNEKTRIYTNRCNFIFLGRDKYGRYARYRQSKRKLKKRFYLYKTGQINLRSLVSSMKNLESLKKCTNFQGQNRLWLDFSLDFFENLVYNIIKEKENRRLEELKNGLY